MQKTALTLLALSLASAAPLLAQETQNKPMRLIVPFPPGGGNDILGRTVAQHLAQIRNQQIIVDNRGGAGGLISNAPAMAITAAPPSKIRERLCILPAPSVPGCRAAARARNTHDQRQDRQQYRHGGDVQNT